jgi:hypothetical protein
MIRSLIASTVALTLLILALPGAAHAARGMELALQDDAVFVDQRWMAREKALDHAADLNTKRIRVNLLWSRLVMNGADQRTPPAGGATYNFTAIDQLQAAAAARGIKLQLTLTGPAPAWATADRKIGANAPDPVKFAAFARTVTAHFKGRVDRYSIWNEPNLSAWLAPSKRAPALYRSLYSAGYKAIKTVDPKAKVLIGELAPNRDGRTIAPLAFLRGVTCSKANYKAARRCAPLKADGLAHHPYQLTSAPDRAAGKADDAPISQLPRLTKALDKLARRGALVTPRKRALDLYLTEFGYLSKGTRAKSASVRSSWLAKAYKIAYRNPRVKQLLQYQLVDPPAAELWHSAILDRHGRRLAPYAGLARAAAAAR